MPRSVFVFSLTYALLLAHAAHASAEWPAKMRAILEPAIAQGTLPGAAVVIVQNNRIVFAQGYGNAEPNGSPSDHKTRFSIGSVSKSFVGLAMLVLARNGQVDLDHTVTNYLPNFSTGTPGPPITLRHLLNHTSGLSRFTGNRNQTLTSQSPSALQEVVTELQDIELQSVPGTAFDYSNANYQVLGRVIEKVTDQPFARAMRQLVFQPLGLFDTRIGHPFGRPGAAAGYRFWGTHLVADAQPMGAALMPQGGVTTNAADMGRYLIALMGGNGEIPNAWHEEMARSHTAGQRQADAYSVGWSVFGSADNPLLVHAGLNAGFSADSAFAPRRKLGVAVLMNASDGFIAGDVAHIGDRVLQAVFPELPVAAVDFNTRYLQLGAAILLLLGLVLWLGLFIRTRAKLSARIATMTNLHFGLVLALPTLALLALAWATGVALPGLFGIPLAGIRLFVPDVGWLVTIVTGFALGWASVRFTTLFVWRYQG